MTEREFEDLLAPGHETRSVEWKPAVERDNSNGVCQRIVRAALAMANNAGGGWILLGVEEDSNGGPVLAGTSPEIRASWNFDDLSSYLNAHADPFVAVYRHEVAYAGKEFLVLRVHEFEDVPVLCRKGEPPVIAKQPPILKTGACYVRSRHKPESVEVPTQTEMRELMDLAIDKGLRKYLARRSSVGDLAPAAQPLAESEKYAAQRGDFK